MTTIDTGTEELLCSLDNGVATVTLNRPDKRNALSDRLIPALREILLVLERNVDARCIIITGAGQAFCAGGDISGVGGDGSALRRRKRKCCTSRVRGWTRAVWPAPSPRDHRPRSVS